MTRIQWTDETWNPTVGCSKVSEGCRNCYAMREAARQARIADASGAPTAAQQAYQRVVKRRGGAGAVLGLPLPQWSGEVVCLPERLDAPSRWRRPRRIFVDSMSDLFHEKVPREFVDRVWAAMLAAPQHRYQVLTKRPQRMRRYLEELTPQRLGCALRDMVGRRELGDPGSVEMLLRPYERLGYVPGVAGGTSVEDQATADERIPQLLGAPLAARFLSCEPLLGPVDLRSLQPVDPPTEIDALAGTHGVVRPHRGDCQRLDQVIVGGESGPGARRCDVDWIRSIVRQCADVSCFVKQLGSAPYTSHQTRPAGEDNCWPTLLRHPKGGDPDEWPADLRVRQFPEALAL